MTEVTKYKFKISKIDDCNDDNYASTIKYNKPVYLSGIPTIFPRPIEKPIEILPNGKYRVTLKKNSENLKFFKTKLKKGCKCKNCWIQRNFELVATI
jgi:hypothetical protein